MVWQSMLHLNGNILVAVDCGTTGLQPRRDSLIEICVLPLNSEIRPNLKIMPFNCLIKPKYIEWCLPEYTKCNREKLCKAQLEGLDPDFAADLFDEWFCKLNLAPTKKLSPLSHNWTFDKAFLIDWLGDLNVTQFFDHRYRDPMTAALFQNDIADFRMEPYLYPKVDLQYMSKTLKCANECPHDTMTDCVTVAETYRRMVVGGFKL